VALFILILAGLAWYRWRTLGFDWGQFFHTLTNLDYRWLAISIVLMLLSYVVRALRWQVMLKPLRPHPDLWGLCSATVIGFTAVVILGRAGELVRPYLISVKERVPFSSQMAAWLLERILDSIVVLMIFGFALSHMPGRQLHLSPGLSWVLETGGYLIAAICTACILFLVLFRYFSTAAQERVLAALTFLPPKAYQKIADAMAAFAQGMQSTRESGYMVRMLGYTVVEWVTVVGAYYGLFVAFSATSWFGIVETLIFVGFAAMGSIVQIPGIGGGVQVATVVVLTEIFGMPLEVASGLAILIWLLGFVIIVPFGVLFAFQEGINWRRFRHLPEDVPTS
jgi:uncharacterized protein (TIRG00374 family)